MSQNRKRKFSINGKQPSEFGMNEEQQGAHNMSRIRTHRTTENQGRGTETVGPKHPSAIDPSKDPNNDPKERLHGAVGVPAKEWLSDESIENLNGLRSRFEVKIAAFRSGYGYLGREEKQILLTNIKMEHSSKLFKDQWFTYGKWSQGIGRGDVIVFDATLKDGKLQYPTNVTLIKSASKTERPKSGSSGTHRGSGGSGVQMEIRF